MKYIESLELREWVKDSLKKTIFQKAHALAVQTGCEILVKLQDTTDIAGCQYYATPNLRRVYRNSKLRQQGESLVSGETGSPLTDKCIQYEDEPTEGTDDVTPDDDGGGSEGAINEDFGNRSVVPMQITAATSMSSNTQTTQSDVEVTNQTFAMPMLVKQEPELSPQYTHSPAMQSMTHAAQGQTGLGAFSYPISPKPYQCSICRKAFKSVHVLQKHTMTFHMPTGGGSVRSGRGKGRGARGSNRPRGRGRGTMLARPTLVQQPFQSPPMPTASTVKPEDDQNRYTCIMCNQSFEQSSQLNEHMSQCPMAPGASQGAQSDPSTSDQFGSPSASAESEDQPGFSGDLVPPTTSSAPNWSFPPADGTPPSGVPVSGASQYYGQQSPTFVSPSQSPRTSGPGSSRTPASPRIILTKSGTPVKRRRCFMCPRARDRKSIIVCLTCEKNVCRDHRDPNNTLYVQCLHCAGLPVPEPDDMYSLIGSSYSLPTMVSIASSSMMSNTKQVPHDTLTSLTTGAQGVSVSNSETSAFFRTDIPMESEAHTTSNTHDGECIEIEVKKETDLE